MALSLEPNGAELHRGLINAGALAELETHLRGTSAAAGIRLYDEAWLDHWLARSPLHDLASSVLEAEARPVRAILFDKSETTNWALGWHQDRAIAVRRRIDVPGFDHWTVKGGAQHVEPPFGLIERMITARVHLDAVTPQNAPLLIAPGSHRVGRVAEAEIEATVARCGMEACVAEAGDVWLYRTAILHASERSSDASRRRVLQVDFSGENLPGGLEWLGIA